MKSRQFDLKKSYSRILKDVTIKPLKPENVAQIVKVWPYRRTGCQEFFENLIALDEDLCLGVFKPDGELMAWCLRLWMGSLGLLQVEEQYLRNGYGALLVTELSRIFAERDYDVTAHIDSDNFKSLGLFKKLGFQKFDFTYWLLLKNNE
jgi:ribosomal protein S18 acetylase RimI-like enzyme